MWGKKHRFGQDFENFAQKWDKKYCFGQNFYYICSLNNANTTLWKQKNSSVENRKYLKYSNV